MQVILLAAGQSKRLHPLGDKNLLEFCGKPLIEHRVLAIKNAKLRDIVVVGNAENSELIRQALKKYNNVVVTEQEDNLGSMAAGVLAGAKKVTQKEILVMSTNDIVEASAFDLVRKNFKEKGVDAFLLARKVHEYFPGGYLDMDKQGWVKRVVEKPKPGKEPSKFINLVIHAFTNFPAFVSYLEKQKGPADGRYEEALSQYIQKGKSKVKALEYRGHFQPIKYPWHILPAMQHFLMEQKSFTDKTAVISKHAVIKGESVHIGKNVHIMEHATLCGPVYIGDNTIVANNALVRASAVGKNSVVGYSTEIARSHLQSNVWTHSNYIGDSVIGNNVSFGAGGVMGNLRLDEGVIKMSVGKEDVDSGLSKLGVVVGDGCRFGINISVMPGVKVGRGCFVGAGVLAVKDIPDLSFVLAEQKIKVTKNKQSVDMATRKGSMKKLSHE